MLRTMSAKISSSRALDVHNFAGPDTWVGPTPQVCLEALVGVRRDLQNQQQRLVASAKLLERQADDLEQQQLVPKMVS
jgi:hypothetical protein